MLVHDLKAHKNYIRTTSHSVSTLVYLLHLNQQSWNVNKAIVCPQIFGHGTTNITTAVNEFLYAHKFSAFKWKWI